MPNFNEVEQQIAIAEACPNKYVGLKKRGLWYRKDACGYTSCEAEAGHFTRDEATQHEYKPKGYEDEWVEVVEFQQPDYLNDLNAIRSVEETIRGTPEFDDYINKLLTLSISGAITATAKQRAEAFLRTIGKWKD